MCGAGGRDPASAGQSGCRRAFFQHFIEHCFWTTRHCESFGEDHDRSSRRIHVDSADTRFAGTQRLAIGLVIGRRTRSDGNPDSGAGARSFTCSHRGITRCESVGVRLLVEATSGQLDRLRLLFRLTGLLLMNNASFFLRFLFRL